MKIRQLSKRQEKRVLAGMLAGLNELPDNRWVTRFKRELISFFIVLLLVLVVVGVVNTQSLLLALFTAIGSAIVGFAAGLAIWRITAVQHWPVVARCLAREKIEARLRELDG